MPVDLCSLLPCNHDPILLPLTIIHLPTNLHSTNKDLTHEFQPRYKYTKQTRNEEVTYTCPNIQPAPLIPNKPEEIHSQDITDSDHNHEQAARRNPQSPIEDAEIGANDNERDDEFEHE